MIGQGFGSSQTQLTTTTLPQHSHSLGSGSVQTIPTGGSQPINLLAPSLPMTYMILTEGNLPNSPGFPWIGMIRSFAGDFAPAGWLPADGRLINIVENNDLYTVIGTTYGGDGATTFALPDLRGRVAVGIDFPNPVLGESTGSPETTLDSSQLPAHVHDLSEGGSTNSTGLSTPISNQQPSLGIRYLIAVAGLLPGTNSDSFSSETPTLGEVIAFAGFTSAPEGFVDCAGQLLAIEANTQLFSLLETAWGGNGLSFFALPDLRGRAPIGVGSGYTVGQAVGTPETILTIATMSSHTHGLTGVLFEDGFE